jgi:integrase
VAAATAEERRLLANIAQFGDVREPMPAPEVEQTETPWSFSNAIDAFKLGKAITKLKPSTNSGYNEIFRTRLVDRFGGLPVHEVGYEQIDKLDAEMVTEGLSPSRRRNVIICVRSVLRAAHDAGRLPAMPKLPALPKKGKKKFFPMTREQVEKILEVSFPAWRLAFALAAYAGLRAGEVRALRWSDVDLDSRLIIVRQSCCKGATSTPKSGHEREIPISELLVPLLGDAKGPKSLVAKPMRREQWGESGLIQAFRSASQKAGIAGFRFHDLRHYFVTQLFRGGGAAPAVQALAGHLHLSTTQQYAHMVRNDLRATIKLLAG